jgi:hypothetical protein
MPAGIHTRKPDRPLMKSRLKRILPLADALLAPVVYVAAYLFKAIRQVGVKRMPLCKRALMRVGVFPIQNHYYEPLFDARLLRYPLDQARSLPGIDWNTDEQLALLGAFSLSDELKDTPLNTSEELVFSMNNGSFGSGDAEYLYNVIRFKKPAKIIEIGSGNSTLITIKALAKNHEEDGGYRCEHICIEPYEAPWLEKTGVTVIRQRVEEVDKGIFYQLGENDILFIDSSHIIRPQGDVLFEYLEVIPSLRAGVIVHIHDIFSPRDYPKGWVIDQVLFWNEQYLLEAFLTCNREWKIIGAINYLSCNHYNQLKEKCPFLTPDRQPGSFYIQKIG